MWDFGRATSTATMEFGKDVTFRIYQPSERPTGKHIQTPNGQGVTVTSRGSALQSGESVQVVPGTKIDDNKGTGGILHGGFTAPTRRSPSSSTRGPSTVDIDGPRRGRPV